MILLSFTLEIEIWCTKCVATLIPRVGLGPGELHPGPIHAVRLSSGILYFSKLRYQAKPICLTKHMFYILLSCPRAITWQRGRGGLLEVLHVHTPVWAWAPLTDTRTHESASILAPEDLRKPRQQDKSRGTPSRLRPQKQLPCSTSSPSLHHGDTWTTARWE